MACTSHRVCQLCPSIFQAETSLLLATSPAQNRRVIGRAARAIESPENFRLFAVYEDDVVVGAACYEISKSYICAAGEVTQVAARSLLSALQQEFDGRFPGLRGCDGPASVVDSISAVCEKVFDCRAVVGDQLEIMTLDAEPQNTMGVQGTLKPVPPRSKLLPILALWFEQFEKDTDNESYSLEGRQQVMSHLSEAAGRQDLFTWEVKDKPVAMAILGRTRPKQLLCVYTPPHQRGRGYGQAVTAATCTAWRKTTDGREPITLSAVSKFGAARIYERVGFRSVGWLYGVSFETRDSNAGTAPTAANSSNTERAACEKSEAADTDIDTDVDTDLVTLEGTDVETDVEADDEEYALADVAVDMEADLGTDLDYWDWDLETDPAKLFASSSALLACP